MNTDEFWRLFGRAPELDDLDRANCDRAGQPGHRLCGICTHGYPVFLCTECAEEAMRKAIEDNP